ncbi:MAG: hypothetical protein AAFW89_00500 [Bacteroidota bacterium]
MELALDIDKRAVQDIQEAINYYEDQEIGLGKEFEEYVNNTLNKLKLSPYYQIRYQDIRCLPLQKYPFMVHYRIEEKHRRILIIAVFNTFRDTKIWKDRTR